MVETPSLPMEASEFCFCVIGQQGFTKLPKWQPLLLPCTKSCVCVCKAQHTISLKLHSPCEVRAIINPIAQMRKLRLRELAHVTQL